MSAQAPALRPYKNAYKNRVEGRFCDCGAPAARYVGDGWSCMRCLSIKPEEFLASSHRGPRSAADWERIRAEQRGAK